MKCTNCGNNIVVNLGSKVSCGGCKVLTNITSIVTVQCDKCHHVFQVPINSKSFLSVSKDDQE